MSRPVPMGQGMSRGARRVAVWVGFLGLVLGWSLPALAFRNVAEGAAAPPFTLTAVSGEKVSLGDFAGKPLVLAFVRQGQEKSRETLADLSAASGALPGGAGVVAVVINVSEGDAAAWAKAAGATYPVLLDEAGEVYGAYGVLVAPSTGVVAADGTFRGEVTGHTADYRREVDNALRVALGEPVVAAPQEAAAASSKSEERKTAERLLEQAKILVKRKMADKGLAAAKEAATADPAWGEPHVLVGELLLDQSDQNAGEAATHFEKALEINPKDGAAKAGLARVKSIQGDHEGAIAHPDRGRSAQPEAGAVVLPAGSRVREGGPVREGGCGLSQGTGEAAAVARTEWRWNEGPAGWA